MAKSEKRILVIDDNGGVVAKINHHNFFGGHPNVHASLCNSMMEAVVAIGEFHPTHLFLDHCLDQDGAVGHEIATKTKRMQPEMVIFSTTGDPSPEILGPYQEIGIGHVDKNEIATRISELLDEK